MELRKSISDKRTLLITQTDMTIRELIQKLETYDQQDAQVCSGYVEQGNHFNLMNIVISEKNQLGDRDAEDKLLLFIGCNLDEDFEI